MKKVVLDGIEYEVVKDYKEAYEETMVQEKYTDYFREFDYIVGDIAYSRLRMKGFYDSNSKKVRSFNNYQNVDSYLKDFCAFDCKYFILKKIA